LIVPAERRQKKKSCRRADTLSRAFEAVALIFKAAASFCRQNRGNGKGKLSPCHNVILGNRKGCIGFQKRIKGQFALICSYLNRKLLILN